MKLIACQECKRQWDASRYREGEKLRCVCNFVMEVPQQRSYTPEVHHCESCGAARPTSPSVSCQYCGAIPTRDAAMLSLVCPFCMHRTANKSRFCSSCGKTLQAGELGARTGKLDCPRCPEARLMNRKVGEFMVDECPSCSGMWVEAAAFDRIVGQQARRQEKEYHRGAIRGRPVRSKLQADQVVYVKCPVCDRHMNRRNFAKASGVIIDECKVDGVWLDCDELGKIATYVASGGLAYTNELQSRQQEEGKKRSTHVPVPAFSPFPAGGALSRSEETPLDSVLHVIQALFS